MILFLLSALFLLVENILLPALVGPSVTFIVPLFALSTVIYSRNLKVSIIQALVFILIAELFSGASLGNLVIPFALTIGIYVWLNSFLNIGSGLEEGRFFITAIGGILVLGLLIYIFSYLFLLLDFSYGMGHDWQELKILFKASILEIVFGAAVFGIIFKYVLKPK